MRLYEITLEPLGGFGTSLKGDTLFGHFCWQAAYDPSLLEGGLQGQLASYPERPFVVFSSAFPKYAENGAARYALKRPDLPLSMLFPSAASNRAQVLLERTQNKKKKWMEVSEDLRVDLTTALYLSDAGLLERFRAQTPRETRRQMLRVGGARLILPFPQPHNTINRMTGTTGTGPFAPYTQESFHCCPGTRLAVFALVDETATDIERVSLALEKIGQCGFGKDASIGLGRFRLIEKRELPLPKPKGANACYTLAPSVPGKNFFSEAYFVPFVRFGKHGDRLARAANPFKNPVITADEGAVFIPREKSAFSRPYLGTAVTGLSKSEPSTVMQGYSIYLPFRLEM